VSVVAYGESLCLLKPSVLSLTAWVYLENSMKEREGSVVEMQPGWGPNVPCSFDCPDYTYDVCKLTILAMVCTTVSALLRDIDRSLAKSNRLTAVSNTPRSNCSYTTPPLTALHNHIWLCI